MWWWWLPFGGGREGEWYTAAAKTAWCLRALSAGYGGSLWVCWRILSLEGDDRRLVVAWRFELPQGGGGGGGALAGALRL